MEHQPKGVEPEARRLGSQRVVASYSSYEEAQRAVVHLSDEGFSVQRVSIVAEDLRFVEQVTGRKGYGQAALEVAGLGALVGVFFGFFLSMFSLVDPLISVLILVLYGLIFGGIVGAMAGLILHTLSGGQRGISSVRGMQAGRYKVMADEEVAEEASRLLTSCSTRRTIA